MTINFKIEYDGLSDEAQNVAHVCGSGLDPVSVYDLSDEALGPLPGADPCMHCGIPVGVTVPCKASDWT